MLKLLIFSIFICFSNAEKFRFDNYSLYKAFPTNDLQIKFLQELHSEDRFDFWSHPVSNQKYVSILSSPENKVYLESYFSTHDIKFEITLQNIQEIIEKQVAQSYTKSNLKSMKWDSYYTLDGIYDWLDDLAAAFPDVASVIIGCSTYEGREIKGLKISHGVGKKVVFIEGGIHSREWISPAVVNYITNDLLTSTDEETQAAAKDFDWYIFPVTNPDGYVWTHTEFRLWRKNRRPIGDEFGVDLNRNWNSNWLGAGSSNISSSNTYAGAGPFSEPETRTEHYLTRTLSEFIRSVADRIELYLSFHSSSQLLLLPFGNTTEPLSNYYDAMKIGRRAMGALSVRYGTQYITGNIAEAIYLATGSSVDWVKEHLNVPLAYCYELRDQGTYGHLLPPEQILPSGEETMDSVLEIIHQARRIGYMNSASSAHGSILIMVLVFASFYGLF